MAIRFTDEVDETILDETPEAITSGVSEPESTSVVGPPQEFQSKIRFTDEEPAAPVAPVEAEPTIAQRAMRAGEFLVEQIVPTARFAPELEDIGGIANAAANALDSARQSMAALNGVTPEEAQEISRLEYQKSARELSPAYSEYLEAEGMDAVKSLLKNPVEITANIAAEGLAGSVYSLGAGLATGAAGAAVGSVVPVVGTTVGFIGGQVAGTFGGSLATEYGGKILEELQTAGMDLKDPESIQKFFGDEKLMESARSQALKRGVPVAIFDAVSAGIGGRIARIPFTQALTKTATREAFTEMGAQAALGGGGEVAGALAAGEEIQPKAVFGEIVGELGTGTVEIAAGKLTTKRPQTPEEKKFTETIVDTQLVTRQAQDVAPATADAVERQVNEILGETETPDERVARLQREAQEAAGEIELEEEGAGLPPVESTPPVTPTPEAAVAPVEPVVAEGEAQPITATRTVEDAIRDKDTFIYNDQRGAVSVEDGVTVFRPFGTQDKFEIGINPNQTIGEIEGIQWARKGQVRTTPVESKPETATIIEENTALTESGQELVTDEEVDQEESALEVPAALVEIQKSQTLNDLADLFDTGDSRVVQEGKRTRKVSQTPEYYRAVTPQQINLANRLIDNALRIIDALPITDQQKQDMAEPYLLLDQDITNYENNPNYQRYKASIRTEVQPAGQAGVFPETETEVAAAIRELEQRAKAEAERLERARVRPPVTPTPAPTPEVREARREPAITPQQDRDYLDAVERGDGGTDNLSVLLRASKAEERPSVYQQWAERNPRAAESLQRVADAAAKAAGFRFGPVFHGTKELFNIFRSDKYEDKLIYFSEREQFSREWARGRKPRQEVLDRINKVRAESKKYVDGLFEAEPSLTNNERDLAIAAKHFEKQKEFERQRLDGMTVSEAQRDAGIRLVRAYLKADNIFDPAKNWREFLPQILTRLGITSESEIEPSVMKGIQDGNYLIWEDKNVMDAVLSKYDAIRIQETSGGPADTIAVRNPEQIKLADPVTYDDQGNIIPLSQRFQPEQADIRYARTERDPEVQKAAQDLKAGTIDREEYQRIVDMRMPLRKFEAVPIPATNDDMLRGLGERTIKRKDAAGNEVTIKKQDLVQAPESIAEGTVLESRLDIPAYENADVWVVSLHEPRPNINKGNAGPVVAYTPTSVLRNVEFGVTEQAAVNIAAGKQKTTIATMKGEFVPMTAEQAYELANTNKEQWVEIGMNPVRHSYFYDKDTQTPVVSAEEVVQVGGMVLAKNPVFGKREDYLYARRVQMGRAGMEQSAVEARLQELGFPTGGIIRVVNEPDADFEGRTIILDGKVTGIELNSAALKDNATIDRVLNHEFAESANADGALNRLVERLTPKEKKEINDTITRLRYEERARTSEEAARAIETLAEAWKGRGFFTRAVARVEAWASKLGFKLTRRAAEYIAARNLADINAGFRTAYNRFINVRGEAREGKIDTTENNKILIGNLYQDQIKSETKLISPTGANSFNHGTLGMSGGLRWRFRIKSGTLAVSDSTDTEGIQQIKNHIERRGFSINSIKSIEEAFEETHKGDAPPVDSVFSQEAFRRAGEGFKSRSKIIRMSIDDFLKLATQLPREQSQEAKNAFDAGIKWDSIPNFETRTDENGVAKIIGHEGRHRALVLKRAGYTEMPVVIIDRAIRWAEQTDPQSYDYVENFPTQLEAERTKERMPFPFSRADGTIKYVPQTAEIRESRREPEAIPTFTEGTPEAATLKEMEASMAKVDAASEAKGGKPETYKISEIASVWMDSGLGERELQDAIVEYTNLTPANAARVAKAIAKQYGLQQQIAETGAVIAEIAPEPEGAPRKSAVTKLIEQTTGVRKPVVKLQVSESAALKKQIQLKAREARETRKARKEAAEELAKSITDYVKANPIRGPINSRQAMSITKKALKLDVNNEAAVDRFEMYVERVIENANYDQDLADARALIKRAKAYAKAESTQGNVKTTLEAIANISPTLLDNPFEFNLVVQRYLLGLAPVTAKQYAVMPDADVRRYLESLETQIKDNQEILDRAKAQRILDKQAAYANEKGIPLDEAISILNSEEFLQEKTIEKLEDLTKLLTAMAQESQKDVKAYDDSGATPKQKELISFMRKVNLDSLINEEKKRYIRFANNLLANGATFGMEQFQSIALGQEAAMKAAKDKRLSNKLAAWISPIGGDKAIDTARRIAAKTQSEADTFKNIFGREAVGAFRNILGLNRLDVAQTDSNRAKEQIANEFGEHFKGLRKKYGDDATGFEAKGYAGIAGYLIQADGNKTEAESIPYRRRLMEQNIVELRKSDKQADLAEADLKERALAQLTGTTNAEILSQLKALNPASYEQLMWVKDVMLPKWRDFLKEHDENFRNQANNYNNPDHLTITYKFPEGQLLPNEIEDVYQQDMVGMRIKQAANSIKRKEHANLPVSKTGTVANIDINFGYNQYNALVDQVDKAFVAPAWEQVVAFTNDKNFEQIMGGRANALFVKKLLTDIQTSRTRQSMTDDEAQLLAGGVRLARKISTQAVLGGITQPLRQVPDQLAKLFFTTGRFDLITKNLLTTAQAAPLLNKFPIGRRGDAQAGTQYASQFSELARKVEASVTDRKWAKYRELMNKVGEFWMTPLRGSDVWAAKVSWMSYYEAELNKKGIKMESWEREAELVDTDQDRKEAASYAEFAVDFYGGASDPTKMASLSKQTNNGWKEFAKLVFLPLNSFALQQKNSLISDLRDAYLRTGDRKASIAAIAGTLAGMAAFHGMRIYIIGGLIYPAGKALLMGIFGIDMDEPDEEEKQKQLEDNWRKFKASMYGNIIAGGAGEFIEKKAIDAVNRTAYLWDANINPDSLLNEKGEIMSFRQYEKEVSPLYRFRSYGLSEYSFGLADVLTEQATHALAETQQLMTPEEMEKYTGNEQAYAAFATAIEWMYFFRLMDTDVKRIATDLKRQMDKEVTERESELKRIREGR